MKRIIVLLGCVLVLTCCKEQQKPTQEWKLQRTLKLEGVNPIGITELNGALWISDGDHNRVVQISNQGEIVKSIDSLDRPMHIDALANTLYIPQYGIDTIATITEEIRTVVSLKDSLDAPAGVSVFEKEMAIADFYNNRILYNNGSDWISFGKEGKAPGELYYPTDVQITKDKIWVADAYNNRIQVFDKKGNFIQMMGENEKMNAATGIFVSKETVFITDFENDRILVFDVNGNLLQVLNQGISKPTDVLVKDGNLYVLNYRTSELLVFELVETASLKNE